MKTTNLIIILLALPLLAIAEQMPSGYYDDINGKQDSILKGTLKSIIRQHTVLDYGSGSNSCWECC